MNDLVEKCKEIEEALWRAEHWQSPPNNPRVVAQPLMYSKAKIHEVEPNHVEH